MLELASNLIAPFVFRNSRKALLHCSGLSRCQRDFNTLIRDWELRLIPLSLLSVMWHEAQRLSFQIPLITILKLGWLECDSCLWCCIIKHYLLSGTRTSAKKLWYHWAAPATGHTYNLVIKRPVIAEGGSGGGSQWAAVPRWSYIKTWQKTLYMAWLDS